MTYEIIEKTIKGKSVEELNLKFVKWSDGKVFCMIEMEDGNWYWYSYLWICEPPKTVSEFDRRYYFNNIEEVIENIESNRNEEGYDSINELEECLDYYKSTEDPEIMENIVNPIVYRYGDFKYI